MALQSAAAVGTLTPASVTAMGRLSGAQEAAAGAATGASGRAPATVVAGRTAGHAGSEHAFLCVWLTKEQWHHVYHAAGCV